MKLTANAGIQGQKRAKMGCNIQEVRLNTFYQVKTELSIITKYSEHIHVSCFIFFLFFVPTGSHSHGGNVMVYVFDINQPSLPTLFSSVLVSVSVFMALPTIFHSINSPDNSSLSHSVLPVLFLLYWSFQLCISLRKSP